MLLDASRRYGMVVFLFKQKTADEMRISDWSSDVCSSDLYKQRTCRTVTAIYPLHPSSMSLEDGKWNFDNGSLRMNDIDPLDLEIGRASCRERVCQYV